MDGFFKFYASFDYAKDVVSPYAGVPVEKQKFDSSAAIVSHDTIQAEKPVQAEEKTNEMFKTYFDRITDPGSNDPMLPTNTCLCIQDPFELNLCVTKGFCEEALGNWKKHCEATSQITSRLLTSGDAKDDKGNLLDIIELTIEAPPKPNKFLAKQQKKALEASSHPFQRVMDEGEAGGAHYTFDFEYDKEKSGESKKKYLSRVKSTLRIVLQSVFRMKIIEMPTTISAPKCLRPQLLEGGETEQEESSSVSGSNGSSHIEKPTKQQQQPSSETKQGQSKLMAALFIHNEGPLQADLDNATKADWQVLQCSALYPLWDYRKRVRTDLGMEHQADFTSNIENEEKISNGIMTAFCNHLTKLPHLAPEIVFDVTAHWLAEPKDRKSVV